ncbi:MAG: AAA family ATPase [Gemmatimonadaceae bacterium]|nr:AAA family ATPase [Gemmatimonadaceae bacterium]
MRLRRLEIQNFRGARTLDWRHIAETSALVGPGDSGKSTILDAIERVLSPKWNVAFDDTDFWDLQTDVPIVIRATITNLEPGFYRDSKFGLLLHGFDATNGEAVRASGDDGEAHALVVELRVDASLEPIWSVVNAEGDKHPFMARDREALGVLRVGGYVDQHLAWSKGSVLTRLTDTGDAVGSVLADATRKARSGLNTDGLEKFTAAAQKVEALGRNLGVAPRNTLAPYLDASALSVAAGAISLHDGRVPTRRAGLGTRRLLAVAMQREAAATSGLTIVDEFEYGLEPHRIRRLLRVLRGRAPEGDGRAQGQLILTTHSPTVLQELESVEVAITRRSPEGDVTVQCLPAAVDYILKRTPHALLARKVVVAEGATEVGICQALDEAWTNETGRSFGYRGVVVVDGGGGTQPAEISGHLAALGYDVALLIDSDAKAKISRAVGARVLAWPKGLCTEQSLANDLPEAAINRMAMVADEHGGRSVREAISDRLGVPRASLREGDPTSWIDAKGLDAFRKAFGDLAKSDHAWFKNRSLGVFLGHLIAEYWEQIPSTSTYEVIGKLKEFVHD